MHFPQLLPQASSMMRHAEVGCKRSLSGPPPNDVDVAATSDSLTRFDLAEVRLDLENESKLAVNLFVLEPNSDRLAELRVGSVPVFERLAA